MHAPQCAACSAGGGAAAHQRTSAVTAEGRTTATATASAVGADASGMLQAHMFQHGRTCCNTAAHVATRPRMLQHGRTRCKKTAPIATRPLTLHHEWLMLQHGRTCCITAQHAATPRTAFSRNFVCTRTRCETARLPAGACCKLDTAQPAMPFTAPQQSMRSIRAMHAALTRFQTDATRRNTMQHVGRCRGTTAFERTLSSSPATSAHARRSA
jgi:hypothetical protein